MTYRFAYRRYTLPFRTPVRTAHGLWAEREGLIVRIENEGGAVGFGEVATISWFGTEDLAEAEEACKELGEYVTDDALAEIPSRLGCLRGALKACIETISQKKPGSCAVIEPKALGVAALLPAGRGVFSKIDPLIDTGFRVFKWKVGVGEMADELAILDDVCSHLPEGAKLRLDANGAWNRQQAERWLERCADRPIEFIEQPCFAEAKEGAGQRERTHDLLLGLAHDFPTPLALDESLVGEKDVDRWLGAGWPGVYVLKPSLCADVPAVLARLSKAKAEVVFSSALETAVGAKIALRYAFGWTGSRRALGFGVWPLFEQAVFDGPYLAPFIRYEEVERLNPEAVWNALR